MAVQLVTQAEYARRRGVSAVAVKKAVDSDRITTVESNGKKMIDPEVADIQWAKNTREKFRPTSSYKLPDPQSPPPSGVVNPDGGPDLPPVASIYDAQAARAKREYHEANLAAMREAKEAGALVDRERVVKLATDAGAAIRASLERIPGLALELAAMSDPLAIQALLTTKITEILADSVDNLRRMTGEAEEDPDGSL